MRNHPILFTLFVIVVIVVVLSGAVLAVVWLSSDRLSPVQFGEQIALIDIKGALADGGRITRLLHVYNREKRVKAIILRIESPGGGVAPAQEIYREIERMRADKPVVAYLGSVAASGGYYVAAAASRVVANPGTLTGSIGVIMQFLSWEELMRKVGVNAVTIKSGTYKDVGSPLRQMSEAEQQMLGRLVEDVHTQFIRDVARGRNLDEEEVRRIADGRILTGRQAEELGLVDELGNFQDAVELAKELGGIKGEPRLVRPKESAPSMLEYFLRGAVRTIFDEIQARGTHFQAVP